MLRYPMKLLWVLSDKTENHKSKMAAAKPVNTAISAAILDSDAIPTAVPMFSRSSCQTEPVATIYN